MNKGVRAALWTAFVLVTFACGLNGACVISTLGSSRNQYSGLFFQAGVCQLFLFGFIGIVLLRWLLRSGKGEEP